MYLTDQTDHHHLPGTVYDDLDLGLGDPVNLPLCRRCAESAVYLHRTGPSQSSGDHLDPIHMPLLDVDLQDLYKYRSSPKKPRCPHPAMGNVYTAVDHAYDMICVYSRSCIRHDLRIQ